MVTVPFTKMSAAGNSFVVVDNRMFAALMNKEKLAAFAKRICKQASVDGLLLLENSLRSSLKMRIINRDGSEAEMCGNGVRCLALYASRRNIAPSNMEVETISGPMQVHIVEEKIGVRMPDPKDARLNFPLEVDGQKFTANFINTGVPHVVIFVDDFEAVKVNSLGKKIRYHQQFKPEGANVDFVEVIDRSNLQIRTYERGVEAETLSCGTGACAAACIFALNRMKRLKGEYKINIHTIDGEILIVSFEIYIKEIRHLYLEGRAEEISDGRLEYV